MFRKYFGLIVFSCIILLSSGCARGQAINIVLLIGDGMGPEQVKAASYYLTGEAEGLFMQSLPFHTRLATGAADNPVTDSAAAATAIAAGVKVNNGALSTRLPGDGSPLVTMLDRAKAEGKSTGLVSTCTTTHATPAGFGAKAKSRNETDEIGRQYLEESRPEVLMGGGGHGVSVDAAKSAGYVVATNRDEMLALRGSDATHVAGLFGDGMMPYETDGLGDLPHLSEMSQVALELLARNSNGFFLMIEGGRIDHAGHSNELDKCVGETVEFDRAVRTVMEWAKGRKDTIVIVTADHETGGLKVMGNNGKGNLPDVEWGTGWHTDTPVDFFAWGPGVESMFEGIEHLVDIPRAIHGDLN